MAQMKPLPSLAPSSPPQPPPLHGIKSNCSRLDKSIWHGSLNYFNPNRPESCADAPRTVRCGIRTSDTDIWESDLLMKEPQRSPPPQGGGSGLPQGPRAFGGAGERGEGATPNWQAFHSPASF
ncbi:unnamed protein product [Gulo gulo]|uniref:Uncharacterized protein n=1 Tax=Gulo gulo TaxID=48420 RepID=A0A9X9M117_GULGU|nr:unnamed protein product [Gulo gulo]